MSEEAVKALVRENIVIVICMTALICAGFWFGLGAHSFWGLSLMLLVNSFGPKKDK